MGYTNCWIIEHRNALPPSIFVEHDRDRARQQFHMLIDTALDHASAPAQISLQWADAAGNLQPIATVYVQRRL